MHLTIFHISYSIKYFIFHINPKIFLIYVPPLILTTDFSSIYTLSLSLTPFYPNRKLFCNSHREMPLNLSPHSLQLSTLNSSSFTQHVSQILNPTLPWTPQKHLCRTHISCASTRPRKKAVPISEKSETEELVRVLMKSFTDKVPLVRTMDKYVRIVRTEHCFLLFEELGKRDKWLQCLEVLL